MAMSQDDAPRAAKPLPPEEDDEFLEIVDELGRVVGAEPRSKCHGDPALAHRAVHVFARNSGGECFLQKRALSKRIQPGKWDTSVGGHVLPGESWERAAARELLEELGVRLDDVGGPSALRHLHDYVWRSPVETEHVRTYELAHDGPFRLDPIEISEGRFWTVEELRAAAGTGVLTPNLEEELRLVGVL
ncbi:MAG: NUDIX hydrolase [Planctomycetota bacterium]